ncbi:MAG TPA: M20/M25/M40 family metallo-hydrolase, partial [Myxococcota bacterium]
MKSFLRLAAVSSAVALAACSTTPLHRDGVAAADRPSAKLNTVDWNAHGRAAFDDLAAYLRVDTVNPAGNERNGADFLAALLAARGIESEIIDHGNNRASLIARVKATKPSGEGAICLVNHIDVVTSELERWPKERGPLSGAIVDEGGETMVYGRGAIDMKGMGLMELHALFALLDAGVERTRDLVFLAVA